MLYHVKTLNDVCIYSSEAASALSDVRSEIWIAYILDLRIGTPAKQSCCDGCNTAQRKGLAAIGRRL